jgi:hypothetical protein
MLNNNKHTLLLPRIDCKDIIAFRTTGLVTCFLYKNKIIKILHSSNLEACACLVVKVQVYK